ncbi:dTDP-4-dehydrorhamnose 3,5-epimerase [Salaquimonas pukyongi]|uniref:dTDP-4-dehydrorhamnose 3,5-epimerase n=1 Tax=Salaquimonas pukyongi TaxID=2712698 RepID=UPI00096BCD3D|nr:dTDP-4-dehydrorhamnose 3,5-epimerase [Salaquimonas pukyongi]
MIAVRPLGLERVFEIRPERFSDSRGFFSETYNHKQFAEAGITEEFVQDNHSCSARAGTLRGLHFQISPLAQAKLVRVLEGAVFDVAVDIRPQSPDYGKWAGIELTAEAGNQIFIPAGFAHGFVTLQDNTQIAYKVDNYYSAAHDRSIHYADPALSIKWPDIGVAFTLSEKDANAPCLHEVQPMKPAGCQGVQ